MRASSQTLISAFVILAAVCLLTQNYINAFSNSGMAHYEESKTEQRAKRFKIKNVVKPITETVKKVEKEVEKDLKQVLKAIEGVGASCKYSKEGEAKRFECDVGFHQKFLVERISVSVGFYLQFDLGTEKVEMGIHAFGKTIVKASFPFHIPDLCYDVVPSVGLCVALDNIRVNKKTDCVAGRLELVIKALGQKLKVLGENVGFHPSKC